MSVRMRRSAIIASGLGALVAASAAVAETSSWVTRSESPPPPAAAAKSKPGTMAKPQPVAPQGGKLPKGTLPPQETTTSFSTLSDKPAKIAAYKLPVSGEEAAQIAFGQGQYLTALNIAESEAGRGRADAYTLVGRIYSEGLGVSRDPVTGARWLARGAELGDVDAMFLLGLKLAEGEGVEKDKTAAADMFQRAALTGHPLANYNLALMFLSGQGKPENPIRAAQHMGYAAQQGVAAAQYDLATLYQTGTGVQPDAYEAARWLRRAAEQGMAEAQFDYAVMLFRGFGLNADMPRAPDYLRAAAEKGVPGAQNRLAHLLLDPERGKTQPVEAAKWRILAKTAGIADDDLDKRVARLSTTDRTAAEAAAREWRERREIEGGR